MIAVFKNTAEIGDRDANPIRQILGGNILIKIGFHKVDYSIDRRIDVYKRQQQDQILQQIQDRTV